MREATSEITLLKERVANAERDLELERRKVRDLHETHKANAKAYNKLKVSQMRLSGPKSSSLGSTGSIRQSQAACAPPSRRSEHHQRFPERSYLRLPSSLPRWSSRGHSPSRQQHGEPRRSESRQSRLADESPGRAGRSSWRTHRSEPWQLVHQASSSSARAAESVERRRSAARRRRRRRLLRRRRHRTDAPQEVGRLCGLEQLRRSGGRSGTRSRRSAATADARVSRSAGRWSETR